MNLRNLTVPITSYDKSKKKYYSPILCATTIRYYPAQLLTGADQALRYICDMTARDRTEVIATALLRKDNSSYVIDDELFK